MLLPADGTGLHCDSKAQAEQVRTVAVERIGRRCGRLDADRIRKLATALRLDLGL
ncbi:type II toxin-antitoxin system PemK/MazF family toxin [Amycolatopsis sulphurea]|uniref:type II toxin-antitoxin system PemK/MazF family toxin n=1 Tax=Amycolatopsis sulphurea TaxID=76022 RepID=UPI0031839041